MRVKVMWRERVCEGESYVREKVCEGESYVREKVM